MGPINWWHILRVRNNALTCSETRRDNFKGGFANHRSRFSLHDVRDWKCAKEQRGSLEDVVEDILKDYPHKKTTLDVINNIGFKEELKTGNQVDNG